MAKSHIVQCRVCKQKFDANEEEAVLIGQKSYYHKKCYTEWIDNRNSLLKNHDSEFYKEALIDYLYRDVKMSIDFMKLESQWANFTKPEKQMTPKGIYFAVRYFIEVQDGDPSKMSGGIGIVPYIYNDSKEYWANLEDRKEGTLEAIVKQIGDRLARPVEKIRPRKKDKDIVQWDLNNL